MEVCIACLELCSHWSRSEQVNLVRVECGIAKGSAKLWKRGLKRLSAWVLVTAHYAV